MAKKSMPKKGNVKDTKASQRKEMAIEKKEDKIAKSLPAGKRKEFSAVQKKEAKLERREK